MLVQDFSGIEDLQTGLTDLGWTAPEIAAIVIYCEQVRAAGGWFANEQQHDDLAQQISTERGPAVDRGWPYSSQQIAELAREIGWQMYHGPLTALNERLDHSGFMVTRAHWAGEGASSRGLFIGNGTVTMPADDNDGAAPAS